MGKKKKIEKSIGSLKKRKNEHKEKIQEYQKNNVPPHLKRCGLQGHLFLGCSEIKSSKLRPHSKECGFNFGHKESGGKNYELVDYWEEEIKRIEKQIEKEEGKLDKD